MEQSFRNSRSLQDAAWKRKKKDTAPLKLEIILVVKLF